MADAPRIDAPRIDAPRIDALWIDATRGAAGDMLLGALLDVGAPVAVVESALASLAAAGSEPIPIDVRQVRRHGLRATLVAVTPEPSTRRRTLPDVLALIDAASLPRPVTEFAADVFAVLARAEAAVHGVDENEVHFHEVGALDALADVVGCASALHALGALEPGAVRVVSEVALGGGLARTEHGPIPVPVPAVLQILSECSAPVSAGAGDRELCTPTGAALLATLATGWGPLPAMTISGSGSGAGTYDPPDRPNIVRLVVGAQRPVVSDWTRSELLVIESTIDDLDPRLWPDVLDALHLAGAADAWLTPVLMRHGRPGHVLTALAPADVAAAVFRTLAATTTTFGARLHEVARWSLHRDSVPVEVAGHVVPVKRGLLDGEAVTLQAEYADARAAARAGGLPIAEVLERARAAAATAPVGRTPRSRF